ncbi:YkvA family protein [Bacillus songklensis]|uniref:YkvA family protein n=1 Tax=Bacillus songklensis TaxID=1069116 RepID=A0ABV8B5A9_9BACI
MLKKLSVWARKVKSDFMVLYLAHKDKRVPWYAKVIAVVVVAYAFSPVDLIPDFIPILGYLDDVILLPLGIVLAMKLIPGYVLSEYRTKVMELEKKEKPKNWVAGIFIIFVWIFILMMVFLYFFNAFMG